ncbi:transglycosylase domain-containing protein [Oerskovia sp. M15]
MNNLQGKPTQGASTITQQYAERYYSDATISDYVGKFSEAMLALRLTQEQDKEEILGNYLNTIYFGRGAHGIEAAAQSYFGVPAAQLTISQAAMITAVVPNPTNFDPAVNPDITQEKWGRVIKRMADQGFITQAERKEAVFPEVKERVQTNSKGGQAGYLLDLVQRELVASGMEEGDLQVKGFTIVTTIDKSMQDLAVATAESIPARATTRPRPT